MKLLALLTVGLLFFSCTTNNKDCATVKLELSTERFEKLSGHYIYLFNPSITQPIDSVIVKSKKVVLNLTTDSSFEPYMVCVKYNDTFSGNTFKRPIGFANPNKKNEIPFLFYIDKGITRFKSYDKDDSTTSIKSFTGSKQNIVYLNNIELSYPSDSNRRETIDRNIRIIKAYPYAMHLLKGLFYYKEHFLDEELKKQLSFFDSDVKRTLLFKSFHDYFSISENFDKSFPSNITLENASGIVGNIINNNSKYNLVIFWASWCGPCRLEIPELKKLYANYDSKKLSIISISIDSEKQSWQTALKQEKMPWPQFIVIDSNRKKLDLNYDIKFIPKVYLFDENKKLIKLLERKNQNIYESLKSIIK
jgi:thiol-disulfide isomerase/thioredoxin